MAAMGSYRDPATRSCFVGCISCSRCEKRGHQGCPHPNTCSGRPDREGMRDPHPDDLCMCKEGTLRWVTKEGKVVIRKFMSSPFKTNVKTDAETEDERDWNSYLRERREAMNDPTYDPIKVTA